MPSPKARQNRLQDRATVPLLRHGERGLETVRGRHGDHGQGLPRYGAGGRRLLIPRHGAGASLGHWVSQLKGAHGLLAPRGESEAPPGEEHQDHLGTLPDTRAEKGFQGRDGDGCPDPKRLMGSLRSCDLWGSFDVSDQPTTRDLLNLRKLAKEIQGKGKRTKKLELLTSKQVMIKLNVTDKKRKIVLFSLRFLQRGYSQAEASRFFAWELHQLRVGHSPPRASTI